MLWVIYIHLFCINHKLFINLAAFICFARNKQNIMIII